MADGINIGGIVADLQADPTQMVQGMNAARAAMAAIEAELKQLDKELADNLITVTAHTDRVDQLATAWATLGVAMRAASDKLVGTNTALAGLNSGMGGAAGASKRLGGALMQMSYIVDDLQYSVMACVNNIGPLVLTMTGSGGLAAACQVAAVGVSQLISHWDQLSNALGMSGVKTAAEEMESLGKQTHKTAAEQARLNKLKREHAEIKTMMEESTTEEDDAEKKVRRAIKDADAGRVVSGVAKAMKDDPLSQFIPEVKAAKKKMVLAELADERDPLLDKKKAAAARKKAYDDEVKDALRAEAERRVNAAATDPAALRRLAKIVRNNPGDFPQGFAGDLANQFPENRDQQQKIEAEGKANAAKAGLAENNKKAGAAQRKKIGSAFGRAFKGVRSEFKRQVGSVARGEAFETRAEAAAKRRREAAAAKAKAIKAKKTREAVKEAEELAPGVDRFATKLGLQAMGSRDPAKAKEQIDDELSRRFQALGMTKENADLAGKEKADLGAKKAGEMVAKAMDRDGEDEERHRKPRRMNAVYGLGDLTNRIQSAVGGDEEKQTRKKQTDLLQTMATGISDMAKQKPIKISVT